MSKYGSGHNATGVHPALSSDTLRKRLPVHREGKDDAIVKLKASKDQRLQDVIGNSIQEGNRPVAVFEGLLEKKLMLLT